MTARREHLLLVILIVLNRSISLHSSRLMVIVIILSAAIIYNHSFALWAKVVI